MRAIVWAAQFPRASMAAQAALTGAAAAHTHTPHSPHVYVYVYVYVCVCVYGCVWRVCRSIVCVTAPTGTAELCSVLSTSFPQASTEQVSSVSDIRQRTRWATSLVERACPHDSGPGVRGCRTEVICRGRARPPSLEHPSISSTLTVGDDIIADGVSLLNVVRMLGPGRGRARTLFTYRVLKTSFFISQSE